MKQFVSALVAVAFAFTAFEGMAQPTSSTVTVDKSQVVEVAKRHRNRHKAKRHRRARAHAQTTYDTTPR